VGQRSAEGCHQNAPCQTLVQWQNIQVICWKKWGRSWPWNRSKSCRKKKKIQKNNNIYWAKLFKGTCMWKCGDTDYFWGPGI